MNDNYYDILGVAKNASETDIKKAYRKLAVECHPDKHPGDKSAEEKFKKINEAYSTLSDKDKRAQYDAMQNGNPFMGGASFRTQRGGVNMDEINDIFGKFFGGGSPFVNPFEERFARSTRQSNRVYDEDESLNLRIQISVSFEEAYNGCKKTITYNTKEPCEACAGQGYDKNSKFIKCPQCEGRGYRITTEETFFGQKERKKVRCKYCNGAGNRRETPCKTCKGSGQKIVQKTISITVPAGSFDGIELKASGCGSKSKNGQKGDLFIAIHVPAISSNGLFTRGPGQDMTSTMNLSYYDIVCGTERSIILPNGDIKKFKIPENCKPGTKIRLKNCGFKNVAGNANIQENGDLIIEISLERLSKLTDEQKELLKKFNDSIKR